MLPCLLAQSLGILKLHEKNLSESLSSQVVMSSEKAKIIRQWPLYMDAQMEVCL